MVAVRVLVLTAVREREIIAFAVREPVAECVREDECVAGRVIVGVRVEVLL